jgi:DNA repair protein RadC
MKAGDKIPGLRVSVVRDVSESAPLYGREATGPEEAAAIARAFIPAGDEREYFLALHVDARNAVKGVTVVSIGTLTASLVHPREVFRPAIVAGAAGVILCHNHPSGVVKPSPEDNETTTRLVNAGRMIGIPVLDHVIVTSAGEAVYSYRRAGRLS